MRPEPPSTTALLIDQMVIPLRGQDVILDADLASLYHVKTKALLQAVKRNRLRFPDDFVFQLTDSEAAQADGRWRGHHGGRRNRPYAFTEQGAAMVASVLNSPLAAQVAIRILRMFAQHRTTAERPSDELAFPGDRAARRIFTALRDAFLLQESDARYTSKGPRTYFLQAGTDGPIKIGSTKNLMVRLRTLCAMSPLPLTLLGIVPTDVEEDCHRQLGAFKLHGEWFSPSPEVIAFIRKNAIAPPPSAENKG